MFPGPSPHLNLNNVPSHKVCPSFFFSLWYRWALGASFWMLTCLILSLLREPLAVWPAGVLIIQSFKTLTSSGSAFQVLWNVIWIICFCWFSYLLCVIPLDFDDKAIQTPKILRLGPYSMGATSGSNHCHIKCWWWDIAYLGIANIKSSTFWHYN